MSSWMYLALMFVSFFLYFLCSRGFLWRVEKCIDDITKINFINLNFLMVEVVAFTFVRLDASLALLVRDMNFLRQVVIDLSLFLCQIGTLD